MGRRKQLSYINALLSRPVRLKAITGTVSTLRMSTRE
jgi:hypothetical protein